VPIVGTLVVVHVLRIRSGAAGAAARLLRSRSPHSCGRFPVEAMANIKQQKKRIRIAADERLENLRYRSTIKTLTRRLANAVEDGEATAVESEHRNLVRWIDRAVSRGALHRNTGARKKSQAARLAAPKA
jgi:small subunit ribosomal protein S20